MDEARKDALSAPQPLEEVLSEVAVVGMVWLRYGVAGESPSLFPELW